MRTVDLWRVSRLADALKVDFGVIGCCATHHTIVLNDESSWKDEEGGQFVWALWKQSSIFSSSKSLFIITMVQCASSKALRENTRKIPQTEFRNFLENFSRKIFRNFLEKSSKLLSRKFRGIFENFSNNFFRGSFETSFVYFLLEATFSREIFEILFFNTSRLLKIAAAAF